MSASLVGSEMCIRDREPWLRITPGRCRSTLLRQRWRSPLSRRWRRLWGLCLLYTSDAADDM
eukprot:3530200-Alexandrium_andersonii.AAC.1